MTRLSSLSDLSSEAFRLSTLRTSGPDRWTCMSWQLGMQRSPKSRHMDSRGAHSDDSSSGSLPAPCLRWQEELTSQAANPADPGGRAATSTVVGQGQLGAGTLPHFQWHRRFLGIWEGVRKASERELASREVFADSGGALWLAVAASRCCT